MAKNNKNAAQAAEAKEQQTAQVENTNGQETTVENIEEQIRSGNKFNEDLAEKAKKRNSEKEEERKIAELAEAQSVARYCNRRELLELKKRRKEEKATKECLNKTKELLDKLEGGELTKVQYDTEIRKAYKKKAEDFTEIDKWFNELTEELKKSFDGWVGTWEYNSRYNRCTW